MSCTVPDCLRPVTVREPVPLCDLDAVRVAVAYLQNRLGDPVPADVPAPPASPADAGPAFDRHVRLAAGWLALEPELSGTAIGKRLGTGDSYGRRVRRAASTAPTEEN